MKLFLLCICLAWTASAYGQKVYSHKVSNASKMCLVMPDKMNVLYVGVENPITVITPCSGEKEIELVAVTKDDSLLPGEVVAKVKAINHLQGKYSLLLYGTGSRAKLFVFKKIGKKRELLHSALFRIKRIPDPCTFISGFKGDVLLTKNELLAAGGIIAKFENLDFDIEATIVSFQVGVSCKGVMYEMAATGAKFTPEMIKIFKALPVGSKVYIENIKAKLPDESIRSLPSIVVKII